jgi:outer membrane lipopolysaccharide assembly protein LptE/RlpB
MSSLSSAHSPDPHLPGSPARFLSGWGSAWASAAVLAVILLTVACGYHLLGAAGAFPPTVKTVAVLPFERQVPVLVLDQRVTEAVTRELVQRARVKVTASKAGADAVLSGAITGYGVAPLSYDTAGRANRFQVTMSAKVKLTTTDGKVLFDSQGYRFTETYESSSGPQGYINQEAVAYDIVARDFARALVASMLEASPSGS